MNILVCEDNPITLKTIEFSLIKNGHGVIRAEDGEQAKKVLDETEVDLVITDINMPYTKGLELVRYINKELGRKIPVVVISGINLDETREHAMELGAAGYLTKPFDPLELMDMVRSLSNP